jgi:hypothetical protein
VRALTAEVAAARPGLAGLDAFVHRTAPELNTLVR